MIAALACSDPVLDPLDGELIDCPICAADPACFVCNGRGAFEAAPLADPVDLANHRWIAAALRRELQ